MGDNTKNDPKDLGFMDENDPLFPLFKDAKINEYLIQKGQIYDKEGFFDPKRIEKFKEDFEVHFSAPESQMLDPVGIAHNKTGIKEEHINAQLEKEGMTPGNIHGLQILVERGDLSKEQAQQIFVLQALSEPVGYNSDKPEEALNMVTKDHFLHEWTTSEGNRDSLLGGYSYIPVSGPERDNLIQAFTTAGVTVLEGVKDGADIVIISEDSLQEMDGTNLSWVQNHLAVDLPPLPKADDNLGLQGFAPESGVITVPDNEVEYGEPIDLPTSAPLAPK